MKKQMGILFAIVLFMFASSLCFAAVESNVSSSSPNMNKRSSVTREEPEGWGLALLLIGILLLSAGIALACIINGAYQVGTVFAVISSVVLVIMKLLADFVY